MVILERTRKQRYEKENLNCYQRKRVCLVFGVVCCKEKLKRSLMEIGKGFA